MVGGVGGAPLRGVDAQTADAFSGDGSFELRGAPAGADVTVTVRTDPPMAAASGPAAPEWGGGTTGAGVSPFLPPLPLPY